jgi:hypothetical protein
MNLNKNFGEWKRRQSDIEKGEELFGLGAPGVYGDWIDLKEGVPTELDVIVGEVSGNLFGYWLLIQKEGEEPKIFSTTPLSDKEQDFLQKSHPHAKRFL